MGNKCGCSESDTQYELENVVILKDAGDDDQC